MQTFDFRSDTTTHPTEKMRQAMASAKVGDDVYGEDPTVNALEEKAAGMLGKERGLFVASGTMGNLLAVLAHCERGEEAIMGTRGHTFLHEAGGVSALGGVVIHTIPNQADGTLTLKDLEYALNDPEDIHSPISKLIIIENTQNFCGGVPLSLEYTESVAAFAREHGLILHLDGARIFNAAVALGLPASKLVAPADSITFCLSKGLCAPVGSVLCGDAAFIKKARRLRKVLGGAMRQAGIIAAAGIVALDEMVDRLAEDHRRAASLAEGLQNIDKVHLTKNAPQTNMVFFTLDESVRLSMAEFLTAMKQEGVLLMDSGPGEYRMVTHHDITDKAVEVALDAFKKVLG
ncbi:MAG TPA: low-specificity L-threonine aldolase [Anaerolineaceae bacterium]|nr:low-specificity L-threonine aldolase [Anaerolineaceae bacterium]